MLMPPCAHEQIYNFTLRKITFKFNTIISIVSTIILYLTNFYGHGIIIMLLVWGISPIYFAPGRKPQ